MYAKKLTAFFLTLALVISCFAMVPVISASAEEPEAQMIVFDQTGNSSTASNILLPLNLPSGGKYRLTFKMRILAGSGTPVIGSLRTSGSAFPFSETGNAYNSATPDASGRYTSYDAESCTFTAVLNIDRYGSLTAAGANCFITIGNAEHNGDTSYESTNYTLSFAMAEPELYKLDGDGNPTGSNLCPAINADTTNLQSTYTFKNSQSCTWASGAAPNIWATDTSAQKTFASPIPQGYFTAGYSYSAPAITAADKMIFIKPTAEEYQVSDVAMPMYLPANGTYRISIAAKTFNDSPVIGFYRGTGAGLLARDADSDASTGGIMNYDSATNRYYWDYSFNYKAYPVTSGYGATGANVVILIGNYSPGKGATGTYDASFMFAAPEVVKLVNGNVASVNLISPITDETLNLSRGSNVSSNGATTSGDLINADFGKWSRVASSRTVQRAFAYDIPDGYFSTGYTATPHMLRLINPSGSYVSQYETSLISGADYKLEYDYRAFNGAVPNVFFQTKATGAAYSSLSPTSSTELNHHVTKTFTMPAGSETGPDNFRFVLGVDATYGTSGTSVYFANLKLCRVTAGVDGENLLPNGNFGFSSGNVTGNDEGWDSGVLATFYKYPQKYKAASVIDIPTGFFTNDIDVDNRMFCIEGGAYTKANVAFNLEASTDYLFKYKYRSVGDEGYINMTQKLNDSSEPALQYTETEDEQTYTKSIYFTTAGNLAAKDNVDVYFCTGANSADKKFYISGLELYKLQGGVIASENIIAGLNPLFGDTGDVSLDEWGNVTSANGYGFEVYDDKGDIEGKLSVLNVPAEFFTYYSYAQRLTLLRRVLLGIDESDGINPYYDPNNDSVTNILDLVRAKKYSVNIGSEGGADALANAKRSAILTAPKALYGENTVYYVDAENGNDSKNGLSQANAKKTLAGLAGLNPASGDTVLFKRGGVYRMPGGGDSETAAISFKAGVRYGVYGDDSLAKPLISGSVYNYATRPWTNVSGNIWKTNIKNQDSSTYHTADSVGSVYLISSGGVITTGKMAQTGTSELAAPGDFYDGEDGYVYVYSVGNPASVYADIEIAQHRDIIVMHSGVQIDNLKVAFGGMHGISGTKLSNVSITNCEVGYIGGAWLTESRAGNGIQFGLGASNITVTNNYVHDCYDAGITFQTWGSTSDMAYNNLTFNNNLIEYCWYNFEFFTVANDTLNNIDISNNIMRMACHGTFELEDRAGYLQSSTYMGANIRCGKDYYYPNTIDFTITNNIFDCSGESLIYWNWYNVSGSAAAHPGLTLSGNSYYQKAGATDFRVMYFGKTENYAHASSQYGLEAAVSAMEASPNTVKWISNMR